ncbi:MAG: hypothetical protein IKE42_25830 [Aquamicrobium sp.]|jgi:hypothetical protein|uniref:hypothetical protein n=1 Tax=Mesorhizobium sp. Pch-S TaxID=2082387 RepID=UPI0010124AC0|nr:hypothetical protein [Mesorhizobium sp. Pch-S]MBR2691287.1 hypothetical protein [Aquamicrobium sp.]
MRILTLVTALSVMAASAPALAQPDQKLPEIAPDHSPQQSVPMPGLSPDQEVTAINIVRVEELPPPDKAQVETKLNETSVAELRELQTSIQASPMAVMMLAQSGLDATQVVAATIDETGTLTLVIQETA